MTDVDLTLLLAAALCAGCVDAVAGGGGLIQVPALLTAFPGSAVSMVFGTNKLASIWGTGVAAWRLGWRAQLPWGMILPAAGGAFAASFAGASVVSVLSKELVRPLVFLLLVMVFVYTLVQPGVGMERREFSVAKGQRVVWSVLTGMAIGFYDGFFGPGTGTFLIFVYVRWFGLDFLRASASAKFVNFATNAAALIWFLPTGSVLVGLGCGMAAFNMAGAMLGSLLAVRHGSVFVRWVFMGVAGVLIARFGYDMLVGR